MWIFCGPKANINAESYHDTFEVASFVGPKLMLWLSHTMTYLMWLI